MELLDIYDTGHNRTGLTVERGLPIDAAAGQRLLVCHIFIFNAARQLLVQKRAAIKARYPDCFDLSAGGFVIAGETSRQAILRETKEELGITLQDSELQFVKTEPFSFVFDDLYLAFRELDPAALTLQKEEVSDAAWMSEEEILSRIRDGSFVDYDPVIIRDIFAFRDRTVQHETIHG